MSKSVSSVGFKPVPVEARKPHKFYCEEPSLAVQSEKGACDVNRIIERALKTNSLSVVSDRVARYGDFTQATDYHSAMNLIVRAEGMFMSLDPKVRERFENDPAKMVDFLQDPANRDEAIKLGLVVKPPLPPTPPGPLPPAETPPGGGVGTKPPVEGGA